MGEVGYMGENGEIGGRKKSNKSEKQGDSHEGGFQQERDRICHLSGVIDGESAHLYTQRNAVFSLFSLSFMVLCPPSHSSLSPSPRASLITLSLYMVM